MMAKRQGHAYKGEEGQQEGRGEAGGGGAAGGGARGRQALTSQGHLESQKYTLLLGIIQYGIIHYNELPINELYSTDKSRRPAVAALQDNSKC